MSISQFVLLSLALAGTNIVLGQNPGDLRLFDDRTTSIPGFASGRLEIYLSGQWGTVCSVGFDAAAATLACNQLGYRTFSSFSPFGTFGLTSTTPIWVSNLSCDVSNHLTIFHCPRTTGNLCSHSQDVRLTCSSPYSTRTFSSRLVTRNEGTSDSLTAGRLEFFFSGRWGSVCSDGLTATDASALCDITTGSTTVLRYGPVGSNGLGFDPAPTSSPIWLQNLNCVARGAGSSSSSCTHDGLGVADCSRDEVAAISCLANDAVRLVNTSSSPLFNDPGGASGRLEFYGNGLWGTVCDDVFTQAEADVVCRQLGYNRASTYGRVGDLGFSPGTRGIIWLASTSGGCTSDSTSLLGCSRLTRQGTLFCSHSEDVAVNCTQSPVVPSSSRPTGALIGSVVGGVIALVAVCCCFFCIFGIIYCQNNINKSGPRPTYISSTTSASNRYPTHQAAPHPSAPPPAASVVMTDNQTEAVVYRPQQEPPFPYPHAQTHAGEAPPDYNTAYNYPKVY